MLRTRDGDVFATVLTNGIRVTSEGVGSCVSKSQILQFDENAALFASTVRPPAPYLTLG